MANASPCDQHAPLEPEAIGLTFSADTEPGITRRRAGRGFSYRDPEGRRLSAPVELQRIRTLAIPPAWTDVWICPEPSGHLQATGRDSRGRKQYRYHPEWRQCRDDDKFDQLADFASALSELRHRVDDDLARPGFGEDKVVALVIALLDRTLIRVGNTEYRRTNGSFGLTTLYGDHLHLDGTTMRFRFAGKSGRRHDVAVTDRRLARLVHRCHELGGRELFTYVDDDGAVRRVDSSACNDYLRAVTGPDTTVKTFRTWGATATVVEALAAAVAGADGSKSSNGSNGLNGSNGERHRTDPLVAATDVAARRLGNTRAVARRSYVHPMVEVGLYDGSLDAAWRGARRTSWLSRAEHATWRLLKASGPR